MRPSRQRLLRFHGQAWRYYRGMPSVRHAVRRRAGLANVSASNEMRHGRMVTLADLDGLRWCSDCTFFEGR